MTKAKVSPIELCPNISCGYELKEKDKEFCPKCNSDIEKPSNEFFGLNDYLTLQLDSHKKRLNVNNLNKPQSKEEKEEWKRVQEEYITWLRVLPFEERQCALIDTHEILKQVLFSRMPKTQIRSLIALGKLIGQQAEAIENYFKAGGAEYDAKVRPIPTDI